MPTVAEILKESGFTDEQIAGLPQGTITAFSGVLSAAEQERQRAEVERQANATFYDTQIVPALTTWDEEKRNIDNERARIAAEAAFYRTQAEQARASGFIPSDAPGFVPPPQQRDTGGRYVAGAPGSTPGSPTFFDVNKIYEKAGDAVGIIADIQWEHQRLFGAPLPVNPSELIKAADRVKLDPRVYAERTYNFEGKRQEIAKQQQEAHDAQIRKEAVTDRDRYWAERVGSNPDVRRPMENAKMTDVSRAVKAGDIPDPLTLNDQQRRALTSQMIRKELNERTD